MWKRLMLGPTLNCSPWLDLPPGSTGCKETLKRWSRTGTRVFSASRISRDVHQQYRSRYLSSYVFIRYYRNKHYVYINSGFLKKTCMYKLKFALCKYLNVHVRCVACCSFGNEGAVMGFPATQSKSTSILLFFFFFF